MKKKTKKFIMKGIVIFTLSFVLGFTFVKILGPIVLLMVKVIQLMYLQYLNLDSNYKFFGTFIFLFIIWKIFIALANIWGSIGTALLKEVKQVKK